MFVTNRRQLVCVLVVVGGISRFFIVVDVGDFFFLFQVFIPRVGRALYGDAYFERGSSLVRQP